MITLPELWQRLTQFASVEQELFASRMNLLRMDGEIKRTQAENEALSDCYIVDQAQIATLKRRVEELESELANEQRMRQIISQCRDDAEQRASGYGKYTSGAV